ncbi:protein FAM83F [Erpetoichthys calabaricus]|uniref:Family with sequence similarity 83 member Fa n=1 Tax=Erpetoichthys calabaricus TaxID=27687 RepID=A0A8C4SZF1_ERPCA|nr:protein FAM83F [Erpetoichthys calabaricus]
MAQSQVVCLEDNHVNEKIPETKPEFYYSEEQRIALEQLLQHGETGYLNSTKQDKIRHFVSAKEREKLLQTFQKYDLDKEESPIQTKGSKKAKSDSEAHSTYWPAQSDTKIPELDIGWPEALYYKGATRVTVHTHPPKDDGPHIKQVVRQMIQGAQKVVAIVMDEFTDIHILKDLVDASYKRKVPVYILLDIEHVSSFIQTCRQLELGEIHLRNIRVRKVEGFGMYLSSGKVPGKISSKFMLVDCDKVMTGTYSFTWMASRIDRNVITVMNGQIADVFNRDFRELYAVSKTVHIFNELGIPVPPKPVKTESKADVKPTTKVTSRFETAAANNGFLNVAAPAYKFNNPKYNLVTGNPLRNSYQNLAKVGGSVGNADSPGIMRRFLQDSKTTTASLCEADIKKVPEIAQPSEAETKKNSANVPPSPATPGPETGRRDSSVKKRSIIYKIFSGKQSIKNNQNTPTINISQASGSQKSLDVLKEEVPKSDGKEKPGKTLEGSVQTLTSLVEDGKESPSPSRSKDRKKGKKDCIMS